MVESKRSQRKVAKMPRDGNKPRKRNYEEFMADHDDQEPMQVDTPAQISKREVKKARRPRKSAKPESKERREKVKRELEEIGAHDEEEVST